MKYSLIILVMILIGLGLYFVLRPAPTSAPETTTSNNPVTTNTATITYTDDGFSPATLTIKVGQPMAVINNSRQQLQLASDPHPTHTNNPELNQAAIGPEQKTTITINQSGTWGYHNHLNPTTAGQIIAQ